VAGEEGIQDLITFTIDTGVVGGVPLSGFGFGAAANREAVINHCASFDFIDGGGLDTVFLGLAECDGSGHVNVSRFGDRIAGCGGAVNLTQRTDQVVFLTTFTSGGLEVAIADGAISILREGNVAKFVHQVGQVTFNADVARDRGQIVIYITERCLFRLGDSGLRLAEVAPGVDVQRDVLDRLPFQVDAEDVELMGRELFLTARMGLRQAILDLRMRDRLSYDPTSNTVFMDYSGMHVRDPEDVDSIVQAVDALLGPLGRRVKSVVNYDRFQLDEAAVEAYADAVRYVQESYYLPDGATRHSTNAFIRLKLGRELAKREVSPSMSESAPET
jgi:propionate CoA-transferase